MEKRMYRETLASIDDLEIEPLSDEDLESVAGGDYSGSTPETCSCVCCAMGATCIEDSEFPVET